MEKPGKRLKKLLTITGTTRAVHAGFKYLLSLVVPFFVGYILALVPWPSARFLSYRMRIIMRGKRYHMPIGVIDGAEFLAVLSVLGMVLYRGALKLYSGGKLLMVQLPVWLEQLDLWPTGDCHRVEHAMGLRPGCVAGTAGDMLYYMVDTCKTAAVPFLMANSMSVSSCLTKATIIGLVVFLVTILSLQEMEDLRDHRNQSVSRKEFNMIGDRLVQTGKTRLRSRGIILLITTGPCIGRTFLIRNPYYIMAGIGVGILDTLPTFGTDTVLILRVALRLTVGDQKQALVLTVLYLVCYFVHQIPETRMMGGQVGLSPLEMLAPVYVGLKLFGFFGFILEPPGLLPIEDMVEAWMKEVERETQKKRHRKRDTERGGLSERLGFVCCRIFI